MDSEHVREAWHKALERRERDPDGAITAAGNAGVKVEIYRVLSGHRSGIDDHYVKRNPQAVKPATDAVYACYFG